MPDSTGFGSYEESGTVVPCLAPDGEEVNFTLQMYLDCEPPIAGGREIWGFPKKYAVPRARVHHDTVVCALDYAGTPAARGTLAYKWDRIPEAEALKSLQKTQINLKLIPSSTGGGSDIAQLIAYNMINIQLKGAWQGPAALQLFPHATCRTAILPVKRIVGGKHYLADITLPYGRVFYDYLKPSDQDLSKGYFSDLNFVQQGVMPAIAPSYNTSHSQIKLMKRQYFTLSYHAKEEDLLDILPDVLEPLEGSMAMIQWIRSEGEGIGAYSKVDLVVPCRLASTGEEFNYQVLSYVDTSAAITFGRERFGYPCKLGQPSLEIHNDTLVGTLTYAKIPVLTATMPYKREPASKLQIQQFVERPVLSLRLIPDCTGALALARLVAVHHRLLGEVNAWTGPAALHIEAHCHAPFSVVPPVGPTTGWEVFSDLTLTSTSIVYDYLDS